MSDFSLCSFSVASSSSRRLFLSPSPLPLPVASSSPRRLFLSPSPSPPPSPPPSPSPSPLPDREGGRVYGSIPATRQKGPPTGDLLLVRSNSPIEKSETFSFSGLRGQKDTGLSPFRGRVSPRSAAESLPVPRPSLSPFRGRVSPRSAAESLPVLRPSLSPRSFRRNGRGRLRRRSSR